jgi:hypothetical protein
MAAHDSKSAEIVSAICRVEPGSDRVTRWIYPGSTMGALVWLAASARLLVSERRAGEDGIRFTILSPADGKILWSEMVIRDQGAVVSWLDSGADLVYGLHAHRATLFAFSLSQQRISAELREIPLGTHCHNALMFGPDGQIWGLTNRCVFAADRELTAARAVVEYEDHADGNFYRFGMCRGPDGTIYFPNGPRLMRVRRERSGDTGRDACATNRGENPVFPSSAL